MEVRSTFVSWFSASTNLSTKNETQVVMLDRVDPFTEPSHWPKEHLNIQGLLLLCECLPAYMCTVSAWSQRSEGVVRPPELALQITVSLHVDPGNGTESLV